MQTVGKKTEISVDHPDGAVGLAVLMEALGTTDYDFVDGLLRQLTNAELDGDKADEANINFLLAVVKDAKPKDHLEAMLLAQMAVVHVDIHGFRAATAPMPKHCRSKIAPSGR